MKVYHFVGATLSNGSPVPEDGVWLEHKGPILPGVSGLYGSEHPCDALEYACGSILCLCDLEGELQPCGNPAGQWVGRRRRIVTRRNVDVLLRRFTADEAQKVDDLWKMPEVVKHYFTTLNEMPREATVAARVIMRIVANPAASREEFRRRVVAAF